MLVDDPYMVRIEAIHAVHGMASDFTKLTEAWLPKGEMPSLRDLFASQVMGRVITSIENSGKTADIYNKAAKEAYNFADALMEARKV